MRVIRISMSSLHSFHSIILLHYSYNCHSNHVFKWYPYLSPYHLTPTLFNIKHLNMINRWITEGRCVSPCTMTVEDSHPPSLLSPLSPPQLLPPSSLTLPLRLITCRQRGLVLPFTCQKSKNSPHNFWSTPTQTHTQTDWLTDWLTNMYSNIRKQRPFRVSLVSCSPHLPVIADAAIEEGRCHPHLPSLSCPPYPTLSFLPSLSFSICHTPYYFSIFHTTPLSFLLLLPFPPTPSQSHRIRVKYNYSTNIPTNIVIKKKKTKNRKRRSWENYTTLSNH